jgi:hypothetical protein
MDTVDTDLTSLMVFTCEQKSRGLNKNSDLPTRTGFLQRSRFGFVIGTTAERIIATNVASDSTAENDSESEGNQEIKTHGGRD